MNLTEEIASFNLSDSAVKLIGRSINCFTLLQLQ